jgi:23S rRNA A2030 N6-methylase RlmJ
MYDHLKQSGNMFDIFKHACLIKAVEINYPGTYFESHCGFASYDKPELWESSWIKVQRLTNCYCTLCDINPEVQNSIPDSNKFNFKCIDGYEEARKLLLHNDFNDLFFIDPPYVDLNDFLKVSELISTFIKMEVKWIVWYPVFKNGLSFKPATSMEMYWKTPNNLYGCGMAFGGFDKVDIKHISKALPFLSYCLSSEHRIRYENI